MVVGLPVKTYYWSPTIFLFVFVREIALFVAERPFFGRLSIVPYGIETTMKKLIILGLLTSQSYLMELKPSTIIRTNPCTILSIVPYGIETHAAACGACLYVFSQSYLMELKLEVPRQMQRPHRALNRTLWN